MSTEQDSLPLAVLDFVGIEYGEGASDSLAGADEIVVVTPSLDRERRKGSYTALADAWRRAA